jgi:hypothetical protein
VSGQAGPGADLVDAHCHSVNVSDLDDADFAMLCTESSLPPAPGTSYRRLIS